MGYFLPLPPVVGTLRAGAGAGVKAVATAFLLLFSESSWPRVLCMPASVSLAGLPELTQGENACHMEEMRAGLDGAPPFCVLL